MAKTLMVFDGIEIGGREDDLCLTDIWKAVGSPETKRPGLWLQQDGTKEFIKFISELENITQDYILRTTRGRNGKTWAHWQIGLAYAKTLDHRLHVEINAVYRRHQEEKTIRQKRIDTRKEYCGILQSHDVRGSGYSQCTNAGYKGMWGLEASALKAKQNIASSSSLRDAMRPSMQAAVTLYEALAAEEISEVGIRGNEACADATFRNAKVVKQAVLESRKARQLPLR